MFTLLIAASFALQSAEKQLPAQPEYGHYVTDAAGLLDVYSEHVIDSIGEVSNAQGRPLYVVTVDSVPGDSSEMYRLHSFATSIYENWRIGANAPRDSPGNRGTLLVLVNMDRQSMIVFGAGWGGVHDRDGVRLTRDVFDRALVSGASGDAIVTGVRMLSRTIARHGGFWSRPLALIPIVAAFLAWLSVVRLKRRRARRAAASEALLGTLAAQLTARQYASLRAAEENVARRVSPSDPPS